MVTKRQEALSVEINGVEYVSVAEAIRLISIKSGRKPGQEISREGWRGLLKTGQICKKYPPIRVGGNLTFIALEEVRNFKPSPRAFIGVNAMKRPGAEKKKLAKAISDKTGRGKKPAAKKKNSDK